MSSLNRAIETFFRNGRLLDRDSKGYLTGYLCNIAALLAICQRDPTQESMALWLAEELVHQDPSDPRAEDIRAGVLWGLDRLEEAAASGLEARQKIPADYNEERRNVIEQNYCYWVAELARAGKDVEGSVQGEVLKKADELFKSNSKDPAILDTVGFVKICLGRSRAEVKEGLALVRKAFRLASQPTRRMRRLNKKLALPFRQRHKVVGRRRIEELSR